MTDASSSVGQCCWALACSVIADLSASPQNSDVCLFGIKVPNTLLVSPRYTIPQLLYKKPACIHVPYCSEEVACPELRWVTFSKCGFTICAVLLPCSDWWVDNFSWITSTSPWTWRGHSFYSYITTGPMHGITNVPCVCQRLCRNVWGSGTLNQAGSQDLEKV